MSEPMESAMSKSTAMAVLGYIQPVFSVDVLGLTVATFSASDFEQTLPIYEALGALEIIDPGNGFFQAYKDGGVLGHQIEIVGSAAERVEAFYSGESLEGQQMLARRAEASAAWGAIAQDVVERTAAGAAWDRIAAGVQWQVIADSMASDAAGEPLLGIPTKRRSP